jgi:hypothetical protein
VLQVSVLVLLYCVTGVSTCTFVLVQQVLEVD